LSQLSQQVIALRFRYKKQSEDPHNWETMPFYLRYLRQFLAEHEGEAVWLKGNTGREEAAYLIFNSELRETIINLMSKPLADLGFYEVTAVSPSEVAQFIFTKEKVGSLILNDIEIGQPLDQLTIKLRQGFWHAPKGTPTGAIFLKAKNVTQHWHENEPWLCLQEVEETVCDSEGNRVGVESHSELWLRETAVLSQLRRDTE